MQSRATTVEQYLRELPEDRRAVVQSVRKVILKHLGKGYEEGMQYGMIGDFVPHSVYAAGHHCDPRQPLSFAALASQKNYFSLYLSCLYQCSREAQWFEQAWAKTGKKLNMGKCCVRFKRLDDVPLEVIGEAIRRVPVKQFIANYEAAIASTPARTARSKSPIRKSAAKLPTTKRQQSRSARRRGD
jgi:hypothetical protein